MEFDKSWTASPGTYVIEITEQYLMKYEGM